jgi:hypothetical protein
VRPKADWPCSSGESDHGSRCSSSVDPDSAILIAPANRAGSPCDSTGSRLPASPAPWRSGPAVRSGTAKPKAADLWRRAEGDLCAAAAGRSPDAEGRRAQVPRRHDVEHGRTAAKRGQRESRSCPRRYGADAKISILFHRFGILSRHNTLAIQGNTTFATPTRRAGRRSGTADRQR